MAITESQKSRTVFDYREDTDPPRSQTEVVAYFAARPDQDGSEPEIEQEDQDSEFLHFGDQADGTTSTKEIIELIKRGEVQDDVEEEDPAEDSEFKSKSKDAMAAAELLQQIVQHRPDLEMALPLGRALREFRAAMAQEGEESKVQTSITSFFK
ncbi:hypothetical protein B0H14DRAFT_2613204 [Mycena olivaceomarginata]|nr:hypothetical protein B0H14DRAFT_2613204 [Mycena olivaceomarginata]